MHDDLAPDELRLDSTAAVPAAPPVLAARTDSEKRRLAALAPDSDDAPTVISARRPQPNGLPAGPRAGDDPLSRRLGHYEILDPIGAGGMASVFRARDLNLGRDVALKILPPEAAADPEQVARFQSEARAAAKLDHENVARVFHVGQDQDLHFIAFEFVEGVNLRTLLERRGPLPAAEAVHYILQVATGLAHAAARGVVHRDVKPSNIIITPAGRAKVVDMGLARHLDAIGGVTQPGVTLGTFDYISPEQALEPRAADARSDIYSLGCTFYHVLTGQPPVPEGTAAKKLHHHQHVPPPDPREANPAVPDEVALVLGRMMAKDPRQRYQRPEDLVHDLLELARRLQPPTGLPGATEGGVLWVDTPVAAPAPRLPALLAVAAILAVAVLVAVIEVTRPAPPRPSGPLLARLTAPPESSPTEPPVPGTPPAPAAPPAAGPAAPRLETTYEAADGDELRRIFRENREPVLRVRLTGDGPYDLRGRSGDGGPAGLVFRGQRLILEGASDPSRPPMEVRFVAGPIAALTVAPGREGEGVDIRLKGVRFVGEPAPGSGPALGAVVGRGLARFEAERCAFVLPEVPSEHPAGALVLAGPEGGEAPAVLLTECLFIHGSRAVQLLGSARVTATHCAFGPHQALVHLSGSADADTSVRLDHCSALLENGAVVHAEDGAGGQVVAGHCLFSRLAADPAGELAGDVVLVRQSGTGRGRLTYQGHRPADGSPQRNGYHNLSAFWRDETMTAGPRRAATLDDARRLFTPDFQDDDALELALSPWQDSRPLARLAAAARPGASPDAARAAFAVNTRLARLRLPRGDGVLGVERNVWGPSYPSGLAPAPAGEPVVRTRVVDPSVRDADPRLGVYPRLADALNAASPDDTILIKANGPLAVEPARLYRPDLRLTLRPFPRYRPVLTLTATPDADDALFRLYDGELTLEELEFVLRTPAPGVRSQAVVALAGNGLCQFRRCVLTLEEVEDAQFAAALVPDADTVARPGDRRPAPRVRFEGCFVRGKGDLLIARGGRRFELELDGTLAALDGSLACVEAGGRDPVAGAMSHVRLRRVTAALTDHVLTLRAARDTERHGPGAPPTQLTCDESLLVAATGRPLVRLENVDADEQVRQLVLWGEGQHTLYGNTGPTILEVVPTSPDRMPLPPSYDQERWLTFTHEPGMAAPFVRVRFAVPFAAERLADSQPADFKARLTDFVPPPEAAAVEFGAPVERLPRPSEE